MVVTGSFCEQPPLGLIKTLERAGCYIVDDDFVQVHRFIEGDITTEGDPLENLVRAFLDPGRRRPHPLRRTRQQGQRARRAGEGERAPRACSSARASFCDPALLDQPMAVKAVEKAGIPWTAFKYSENSGQFQVIREQAGTFADSIKLWSEA